MTFRKELRETLGQHYTALETLRREHDERRAAGKTGEEAWSPAHETAWSEANTAYDATKRSLDEIEHSEALGKRLKELHSEADSRGYFRVTEDRGALNKDDSYEARQEKRLLGMQAWCRGGQDCSERQLDAAKELGIDLRSDAITFHLLDSRDFAGVQHSLRSGRPIGERRAMSGHLGSSGGFLVPDSFVMQLEQNMLAYGSVMQAAEVMTTDTGETMSWPTADDTSNEGEMVGENQAVSSDEDPTFKAIKFHAYDFTSKIVKVPVSLMDDSAFGLDAYLGLALGERIGRATNRKFTSGTGANQPKGIVTCSTVGKTTAGATAITADEVIDLEASIDPAYREGSSFMMHDNIVTYLRKLKDADGRYLWSAGLQAGTPDRLCNRPLFYNQHMDSAVATANKTILFGALGKYKVRRVRSIRLVRFAERFMDSLQVGFMAHLRCDGNLLDAGTTPVKHLRQA